MADNSDDLEIEVDYLGYDGDPQLQYNISEDEMPRDTFDRLQSEAAQKGDQTLWEDSRKTWAGHWTFQKFNNTNPNFDPEAFELFFLEQVELGNINDNLREILKGKYIELFGPTES